MFTLPGGQVCVTVGDVAGSGLAAAVIMGRIRSALRAYALETTDPAEVLSRLDRKMQYFEPDALATVAYGVFEPGLDQVQVALAGHLPPVMARPGERAELADVQIGAPIGAAPRAQRPLTTVPVPPGALRGTAGHHRRCGPADPRDNRPRRRYPPLRQPGGSPRGDVAWRGEIARPLA